MNLQVVQDALRKYEKNNRLDLNCSTNELCCQEGENFGSKIYRLIVKGSFKIDNCNDVETYEKHLIVKKILVDNNLVKMDSGILFTNERLAYNVIIPILKKYVNTKLPVPDCIHACDKMILLNDLKKNGFKCWTNINELNFTQVSRVLWAVAKIHSASIILNIINPAKFNELAGTITNFKFKENSALKLYQEDHLKLAIKMLRCCEPNAKVEKSIGVLTSLVGYSFRMQKLLFEERRPLDVITHGDLWSNNIMYNEIDEQLILIDFQLMICTSLAADLTYFYHVCLHPQNRQSRKEDFLKKYLSCLTYALNEHHVNADIIKQYNFEWLSTEFERFRLYGFMSALWMLPVFYPIGKASETKPVENLINVDYLFKHASLEYRERLLDLVFDFVENYVGEQKTIVVQ